MKFLQEYLNSQRPTFANEQERSDFLAVLAQCAAGAPDNSPMWFDSVFDHFSEKFSYDVPEPAFPLSDERARKIVDQVHDEWPLEEAVMRYRDDGLPLTDQEVNLLEIYLEDLSQWKRAERTAYRKWDAIHQLEQQTTWHSIYAHMLALKVWSTVKAIPVVRHAGRVHLEVYGSVPMRATELQPTANVQPGQPAPGNGRS